MFILQARTLEQKRRWCLQLKRLILENYAAVIPDKAKELVMMLGKSREEQGNMPAKYILRMPITSFSSILYKHLIPNIFNW